MSRSFGVARNAVSGWLQEEAEALSPLEETRRLAEWHEVLELDELWSLVRSKTFVRWLWVARCRRTRQVVAFVFSDRMHEVCFRL